MRPETDSIFLSEGEYSFEIVFPDKKNIPVGRFLRLFGGEKVFFKLVFEKPQRLDSFSLHTNLGGSWDFLAFEKVPKNPQEYVLEQVLPQGGYFKFRFSAIKGKSRLWEAEPYRQLLIDPPEARIFKMYTFIPSVSGKISDWIGHLARIKELGFNVIHLLPFTKMGSSQSPYSSVDLFEIDPSYVDSENDFEKFIDAAAGLDLKICYDIVLNHLSNESNLARERAHWLIPDAERVDGLKRAGCWHQGNRIIWEDLVLINYSHPVPDIKEDIFNYMKKYVVNLIKKSKRCSSVLRLDNLHSSTPAFIIRLLKEIKEEYPETIILSEYFGSDAVLEEGVKQYGLNMLTANSWEYPFAPLFKNYLEHIHETGDTVKYFLSPTSHDTGAVPELFGDVLSSIPRYFCCALMGTGQTGIVQGFETGIAGKINFIGKPEKINPGGSEDFSDFLKQVNNLLSIETVFSNCGNAEFINVGDDSLIFCIRKDEKEEDSFLLAANFNTQKAVKICRTFEGRLNELINFGAECNLLEDNKISIRLERCGVVALHLKKGS